MRVDPAVVERGQRAARVLDHPLPADHSAGLEVVLVAKHEVLADGQVRHQRELLEDAEQPGARRLAVAAEADLVAVELDPPRVGRDHAADHVEQRRLAGAVLADQPKHLAGRASIVDVVQRPGRPKRFETPTARRIGSALT